MDRVRWREAGAWRPIPCPSGFCPFPHSWIVDAPVALFRAQLGKNFGKMFCENLEAVVRRGPHPGLRGDLTHPASLSIHGEGGAYLCFCFLASRARECTGSGPDGKPEVQHEDAKPTQVFWFVLVSRVRERPGRWCGRKKRGAKRRTCFLLFTILIRQAKDLWTCVQWFFAGRIMRFLASRVDTPGHPQAAVA